MFSFIAFSWFLSIGIVPLQMDCVNKRTTQITTMATMAEVGVSATLFKRLTISSSMENYQIMNGMYFNPYRIDYKFSSKLILTKGVSANFEHECDHPVVSESNEELTYRYMSSVTKIFLKIEK